jgi:hypothetical protein
VVLAIEVYAVEGLLQGVLVERRAEVFDDLVRLVETDIVAEGNEGINDLGIVNAHGERSREPRYPSRRNVE